VTQRTDLRATNGVRASGMYFTKIILNKCSLWAKLSAVRMERERGAGCGFRNATASGKESKPLENYSHDY
jgi:hypothetical protein